MRGLRLPSAGLAPPCRGTAGEMGGEPDCNSVPRFTRADKRRVMVTARVTSLPSCSAAVGVGLGEGGRHGTGHGLDRSWVQGDVRTWHPKAVSLARPTAGRSQPPQPRRRKENVSAPGSTSPLAASTSQQAGKALRGGGLCFQAGSCHLAGQVGKRPYLPPSPSPSLISSLGKEEFCCQKGDSSFGWSQQAPAPVQ